MQFNIGQNKLQRKYCALAWAWLRNLKQDWQGTINAPKQPDVWIAYWREWSKQWLWGNKQSKKAFPIKSIQQKQRTNWIISSWRDRTAANPGQAGRGTNHARNHQSHQGNEEQCGPRRIRSDSKVFEALLWGTIPRDSWSHQSILEWWIREPALRGKWHPWVLCTKWRATTTIATNTKAAALHQDLMRQPQLLSGPIALYGAQA